MDDKKIEKVIAAATRAERIPKRLGWKITAVLYGHGKVIVQAVTFKGLPAQFTEKI